MSTGPNRFVTNSESVQKGNCLNTLLKGAAGFTIAAIFLFAAMQSNANSAEPSVPAGTSAASGEEGALEGIIVTAEKRNTDLQRMPSQ